MSNSETRQDAESGDIKYILNRVGEKRYWILRYVENVFGIFVTISRGEHRSYDYISNVGKIPKKKQPHQK